MSSYITHNGMVWEYFDLLDRISREIPSIPDAKARRQNVALCLVMAVAVVEAFFNLFFRRMVREPNYSQFEAYVLQCLKDHESLDYKIKHWPNKILNKNLDLTSGIGKSFSELKVMRNNLMHFAFPSQPVEIDNHQYPILIDISFYDNLKDSQASDALDVAALFIQKVIELSGVKSDQLSGIMRSWTGRPPA